MGKKSRRSNNTNNGSPLSTWVAAEAARIYVNEHCKDLHASKLKAAKRLGIDNKNNLPSNEEIEAAIQSYQNLFLSGQQTSTIRKIQHTALTAMDFFQGFKPRIVGALANNTATVESGIYLHLFCDHPEQVDWFLIDKQIPFDTFNKKYFIDNQKAATIVAAYGFIAENTPIEVSVFPEINLRQQVRCSIQGRAIERVSLHTFQTRLSSNDL